MSSKTTKDKKNKKRYRFLFLLSLLAIIALIAIVYALDSKLETYEKSDTVPASELDELDSEFASLEDFIEVDDIWILNNEPEKALERYKNFEISDEKYQRKINLRIKRLQEILESENDDELTKINLRTELRNAVDARDSISNVLDSTQQSYRLTFNQMSRRNDSLENELNTKSRELNRKETLKVISFKSDKNVLIHYIGETENNAANGSGVGVWANGSIYRGEWTGNKPNGKGEFQWADGAKYEGDFVMGDRTGEGTFRYPTGEKYEGEFKNGLRSGSGTLYDIDGNVSYEGNWENDKPIQ